MRLRGLRVARACSAPPGECVALFGICPLSLVTCRWPGAGAASALHGPSIVTGALREFRYNCAARRSARGGFPGESEDCGGDFVANAQQKSATHNVTKSLIMEVSIPRKGRAGPGSVRRDDAGKRPPDADRARGAGHGRAKTTGTAFDPRSRRAHVSADAVAGAGLRKALLHSSGPPAGATGAGQRPIVSNPGVADPTSPGPGSMT